MTEHWWQKPFFWICSALLVVLVLFMMKIYAENLYLSQTPSNESLGTPEENIMTNAKAPGDITISPQDPSLGTDDAKVVIVELADFECPYCAQTAPIVFKFTQDHLSQVRLVWKDFIIPNHANSLSAAQAAQCAARQGKFWEYQQYLFSNQEKLGSELYLSLAQNLSLDVAKFTSCMVNNETLPLIQFNQQEINTIGFKETPAYIINGQLYEGDITTAALEQFLITP
ncbi:MAG: thioredoxin domain-containing protein [Patescibacteria group bacterium]